MRVERDLAAGIPVIGALAWRQRLGIQHASGGVGWRRLDCWGQRRPSSKPASVPLAIFAPLNPPRSGIGERILQKNRAPWGQMQAVAGQPIQGCDTSRPYKTLELPCCLLVRRHAGCEDDRESRAVLTW